MRILLLCLNKSSGHPSVHWRDFTPVFAAFRFLHYEEKCVRKAASKKSQQKLISRVKRHSHLAVQTSRLVCHYAEATA